MGEALEMVRIGLGILDRSGEDPGRELREGSREFWYPTRCSVEPIERSL